MTKQEVLEALQEKHERARRECIRLLTELATSDGPAFTEEQHAVLSKQWKQMNALSELVQLVHQLYNDGAAKPPQPAQVLQ